MRSEDTNPEALYNELLVSEIDFYRFEIRVLRQQAHAVTAPFETFDRHFIFEAGDDDLSVARFRLRMHGQ